MSLRRSITAPLDDGRRWIMGVSIVRVGVSIVRAVPVVGLPVRLKETPGSVRLPAPEFGEHTEQILTEILGYSWERVGELKDREVI